MAESSRFSTFTVFGGGSCAAEVACFPPDVTTAPPVTIATTRTAAPVSTQVFRVTGPATPARLSRWRCSDPPRPGPPKCSKRPSRRRIGIRIFSTRESFEVGFGEGPSHCCRAHTGRTSPPFRDRRQYCRPFSFRCRRKARACELGDGHLLPGSEMNVASSAPSAEAMSCSASGLPLPVTRQVHRRTASATCRRPSPTAAAASRRDAGVVHFRARERRVGEVRHAVGADAWAQFNHACCWAAVSCWPVEFHGDGRALQA